MFTWTKTRWRISKDVWKWLARLLTRARVLWYRLSFFFDFSLFEFCISFRISFIEVLASSVSYFSHQVDNTNPSLHHRKPYVQYAKKGIRIILKSIFYLWIAAGMPARCFLFPMDIDLAKHLNQYREVFEKFEFMLRFYLFKFLTEKGREESRARDSI